jgi:hypothetical protein
MMWPRTADYKARISRREAVKVIVKDGSGTDFTSTYIVIVSSQKWIDGNFTVRGWVYLEAKECLETLKVQNDSNYCRGFRAI